MCEGKTDVERRQAVYVGRASLKFVEAAFAVVLIASVVSSDALAQRNSGPALTRVTLAQISRLAMFAPLYGAIRNRLFAKHGIEIDLKTTLGPHATMAALLNGEAAIGMAGPEQAVLVARGAANDRVKIIAAISNFDGTFLVSRQKITKNDFRWDMLKGKKVIGWRQGSAPSLYFEQALRSKRINPRADFDYITGTPIPARARAWRGGRGDFGIFFEPRVSQFEKEGVGYPVASVGKAAGPSVYTVFMARADFIERNPDTIQKFAHAIQDALAWTATTEAKEAAKIVAHYLPRAAPEDIATAIRRYRQIGFWKKHPTVERKAISKIQSMMIESGVIRPDKIVRYEAIVAPQFAENAKRLAAKTAPAR